MKSEARVVVIGGGIVGVAVLYHLTKLGCDDVVLVERKQLTAGSTWHAAAGFHSLNGSGTMARLQAYSIRCYDEVAEISGQDVGMHRTGSVACAATEDWWDFLKVVNELNRTLGIESHLIGPEEVSRYSRIIDPGQLVGAMVDPADGYLDPSGATHAYAKAARLGGAEIALNTTVTALQRRDDDTWNVVTDQGTIHTQHVVNAAGLWAREVARMAGHRAPLVPYEHHYLVTEAIPAIRAQAQESMTTVDLEGGIYVREEVGGLLFGVYEPGPVPWALGGTPWTYGESELLHPRLDALAPTLERAFRRFPIMQDAGIKNVVNGPFTFTPDGNPLVGPVRGLPNYWLACGCMAGFSQSGGIGLTLAEWILEGEPTGDVFALDPARFGDFATDGYTLETSTQFYEWRFKVPYPNEPWPAGRPAKTTPIYDLQQANGAVFGALAGVEVPMWFAVDGADPVDVPTFFRPNSFDATAREVGLAHHGVAVLDTSSYSTFDISGPGARQWLDALLASTLPTPGRARLAVMLSESGRIIGDFTLFCLPTQAGGERFLLTGSGSVQEWHMRWFSRFLPSSGVTVRNVTDELMGLAVTGPRSRDVLQRLTATDLSADAFRLMSVIETEIGGAPVILDRLSLTGELGFELWVPPLYHRRVYQQLHRAGAADGIGDIGVHALLSMRLEKGFGIWGREYSPDYTPAQNEIHRFVRLDKPGFVGREAALADSEREPQRRLVTLEIDAARSDANGFEPVYRGDDVVGYVTSGGYGHRTSKSLALAYVDTAAIRAASAGEPLSVPLVGRRSAAVLTDSCVFDPAGERMRS